MKEAPSLSLRIIDETGSTNLLIILYVKNILIIILSLYINRSTEGNRRQKDTGEGNVEIVDVLSFLYLVAARPLTYSLFLIPSSEGTDIKLNCIPSIKQEPNTEKRTRKKSEK